jgi:hypothetical protein
MSLYTVALFLHVIGALGFFVSLGLEWVAVAQLRRAATVEQAREWLKLYGFLPWIGGPAMALILILGIYMVAVTWGPVAWAAVALGAMVLYSSLAGITNARRIPALRRAVEPSESATGSLQELLRDPRPWTVIQVRTGLALGIVFLMTAKPDLVVSLIAVAVGALAGLFAGLLGRSPRPQPAVDQS